MCRLRGGRLERKELSSPGDKTNNHEHGGHNSNSGAGRSGGDSTGARVLVGIVISVVVHGGESVQPPKKLGEEEVESPSCGAGGRDGGEWRVRRV